MVENGKLIENPPFQPKGEVAEWRMLYDMFKEKDYNEVIEYREMDKALGRPFRDNRSPFDRMKKEMQDLETKTLTNVRGVGYRIILPPEHAKLGIFHIEQARDRLKKGIGEVKSANPTMMSDEEKNDNVEVEVRLRVMHADTKATVREAKKILAKEKSQKKEEAKKDEMELLRKHGHQARKLRIKQGILPMMRIQLKTMLKERQINLRGYIKHSGSQLIGTGEREMESADINIMPLLEWIKTAIWIQV